MVIQKIEIEISSESSNCEVEIATITANSSLYGIFDKNGVDDYYITIKSETGVSFDDKEELIGLIDKLANAVNSLK